jgi:hypothetical protein
MHPLTKIYEYGGGVTSTAPFLPESVFIGDRTADCRGTENNPIIRK